MSSGFSSVSGMAVYRAHSLFKPHRAREAIKDAHEGKIPPAIGLYLGLSTVVGARFVAPMGFDWVWIDWEHSSCNVETMTSMVHEIMFCSEGRTLPFVRIPGHDHAAIGFALDAGASVIIPQVETASLQVEQAKHVCSSAKYGTADNGTRSAPPFRLIPGVTDSSYYPGKTIHQSLNDQAAIMIQIETLRGIKNLDAILAECPQIDMVWLGALDVRVSMNLGGGFNGPEPEWQEAVEIYNAATKKHNKPTASFVFGDPETMEAAGKGKAFMVVAADALALQTVMTQAAGARELFPKLNSKGQASGEQSGDPNGETVGEKKGNRLILNGKH